jgi:hypothetical protein
MFNARPTFSYKIIIILFALVQINCGSNNSASSSDGSTSVTAASNISGAANSSEGQAFNFEVTKKSYARLFLERFSPTNALASTCISTISSSTCSGSALTVPLASCILIGNSSSATGSLIFTWSSGSCVNPPSSSAANAVFTRAAGDPANPIVITSGNYSLTLTTQTSTGYSTGKSGGLTITCGSSGCSSGRSITINGTNWVGTSELGTFNHTISTTSPITITGSGSSRSVTGGTVTTQHNLAQYTATSTIASPLGFTAGCCHPTSGSLSTSFSGGAFNGKSESLTFNSTCGSGTLTNSNGSTSTVFLRFCI